MKMTQKMNWIRLILCAMFVCMVHAASAQQIAVRGQVLDAGTKEPMIGVSVLEKGTTNGTITDFDGNYSLNVASGKTLVFSYIGYVTQEIVVSGETVNVSMKEDSKTLSEVVVVGYGVQKKSSVTGAISQVKTELCRVRQPVCRSFLLLQLRVLHLQYVYVVSLLTFHPIRCM